MSFIDDLKMWDEGNEIVYPKTEKKTLVAKDPRFEPMHDYGFGWNDSNCEILDCMDGLKLIYEGKEVEGEVVTYEEPKNPIYKEIVFSLDGKKYKFTVEEVQ